MASAPKDGDNVPGSKAPSLSCFPSEAERLQLIRKADFKNQGTLVNFPDHSCRVSRDIYQAMLFFAF